MSFDRGDVVLVRFVFADEKGAKRRPVLVLSGQAYHSGRQEVIVAAMTSNVARVLPSDHEVKDWKRANLPRPSLVTGILRTIKQPMVESKLGRISPRDLKSYQALLRDTLGL